MTTLESYVNIYPYAGNFTEEYDDGTKAEDKLYFGSRESAEHYVREVNRAGLKFRIIKAAINKRICLRKKNKINLAKLAKMSLINA